MRDAFTFKLWRDSRKWFDRLEDHAAGSSDTEGWGYSPGWIAKVGDDLLQEGGWWTISSSEDFTSKSLDRAERWLWDHYAKYEVAR